MHPGQGKADRNVGDDTSLAGCKSTRAPHPELPHLG
jgi:hypothetical protein